MAMKRLQAMEGMRDYAIFFKKRYTAAELKDRARPEALEGCTLTICGNLGPFSCARQKDRRSGPKEGKCCHSHSARKEAPQLLSRAMSGWLSLHLKTEFNEAAGDCF